MKKKYYLSKSEPNRSNFWGTNKLDITIKFILILFLYISGSLIASAQTFVGFKEVYSQADVNDLGAEGYTNITLGLYIRNSSDITDLTPLSSLTSLGGLFIGDNLALTNLNGLQNLTTITGNTGEGLYITRNDNLSSLAGLSGLQNIPARVWVELNPSLTSLNGLSLQTSTQLVIQQNNSLQNLNGLENLVTVGPDGLSIHSNPSLVDLNALNSLTTASNTGISISDNTSLVQINGFNNLTSTDNVFISGNTLLSNYCGLTNWAAANPTFPNFSAAINAYDPSLQQVITACDGAAANPMTTIFDPIFEQYLIQNGTDTNPTLDGFVLTTAISNLTELKINSFNIADFTGLEDFMSLVEFEMINNQAASIQEIDFSGNPQLNSILIVSTPNLLGVDISANNQITDLSVFPRGLLFTNLDLTGKSTITNLGIGDSGITELDLSGVPNLIGLGIQLNSLLTSIDVSGLANLEAIATYESGLTALDLSSNNKLTRLDSNDGALTSVNLKNGFNTLLTSVELNGNSGLTCIEVDDVTLATQQTNAGNWVKDASATYSINCNALPTTQILDDAFEAFLEDIGAGDGIANNDLVNLTAVQNVTLLQMSGGFNGQQIQSLAGIEAFSILETLDVSFNQLTALPLASNANLISLNANSNQIASVTFSNSASLQVIELNSNNLANIDISTLFGLEVLQVSDNSLTTIDVSNNSGVEVLDVSDNLLTSLDVTNMAPILNTLNFSLNQIPNINLSTATALSSLTAFESGLTSLSLKNLSFGQLANVNVNLNQGLTCIEVSNVVSAEQEVTNGNWFVDSIPGLFKLDCTTNTCTPITITDPEFKDFLINNSFEDINGNFISISQSGEVCAELAATIVTLDLTSGLIDTFTLATLAGIEAFTELKSLNIGQDYQVLSDVDVSQNLNLEVLIASSFKGSGFSLQLENNAKLRELYTYNSGASLTISPQNNPLLEVLSIGAFDINPFPQSSLNLSAYPNLKEFWAQEIGDITSFGLSNAINLESVTISQSSGFTAVELSGSPVLESVALNGNSDLNFIDIKNGSNTQIQYVGIFQNGSNTCVQVDNLIYTQEQISLSNWFISEANTTENCSNSTINLIQFVQSSSAGFEVENSNLPQLLINGTVTNTSTVTIEDLTNGTATPSTTTSDGDYILNGGTITYTITIPPGVYDGTTPFSLPDFEILDDFTFENDETLNLQITGVTGDLAIGIITDTQYTIREDDYILGFVAVDDEASEAGDTGSFTIGLFDDTGSIVTNNTGGDLFISFGYSGTASASDFNSSTSGVFIPQGDDSVFIPITAVDDSLVEGSETIICTLIQGVNYKLDNSKPQTDVITILDNDSGTPTTFEAEVQVVTDILNTTNVNEGNTDIFLQMSIPNADTDNLLLDFDIEVVEMSATADADFGAIPANETFSYEYFNDGLSIYNIGILQDGLLESNEQFIIRISNPSDSRVQLKNANANGVLEFVVTILDNETANAVLTGTGGIEGGNARFQVSLQDADGNAITNNTGIDIDFDIILSDGTAIASADYTNPGANAKITVGNLAFGGFIEVPLLDDTDAEPQENLSATVSNPSFANVTITQATADATIAASDNTGGDSDSDGVLDAADNCPDTPNANQADLDSDGEGDVCDTDRDGDGVLNVDDTCPDLAGVAANNGCPQSDSDGDGILDATDNCINTANADQLDTDGDGIGDVCDTDIDGDGVPNNNDNCILIANSGQEDADNDGIGNVCDTPDTTSDLILNPEDLSIIVQAESCPDVPNGSLVVVAAVDHDFTVTITNSNLATPIQASLNMDTVYSVGNLAAGAYTVCITAAAFPSFEQCFVANVLNSDRISVSGKSLDLSSKTASFSVVGSTTYTVQVNTKTYQYDFDSSKESLIEVPMEDGQNQIQITGTSDCQGIFKDAIFLGKVSPYPNPVVDTLHLSGIADSETSEISIVNLNGTVVRRASKNSASGNITINVSDLSNGIYVVFVKNAAQDSTFKIIKK